MGWDIGFATTWLSLILIFAVPAFIFYKARTRIFFLLFSGALFWLTTPILYHVLTGLYLGLIILGFVLITVAFWKGYINKKILFGLYGIMISIGVAAFYFFFRGSEGRANLGPPVSEGGPNYSVYLFILISIFAIGFFIYRRYDISALTDYFEEEEESIESEISSTVESAISEIYEGKDIESTIMKCYEHMCLILEEQGVSDEEYLTTREFEKVANDTLDVPTSNISRIREIFELARYSSHELREKDKDEVIKDLKALKEELK
ncbi:MAG: DUF4129 domain-containing protein [Candidatus Thermoplasmatota archaeon]